MCTCNGSCNCFDNSLIVIPKGDTGDQGPNGADGTDGINGTNGVDGTDGIDGVDANNIPTVYTVTANVGVITNAVPGISFAGTSYTVPGGTGIGTYELHWQGTVQIAWDNAFIYNIYVNGVALDINLERIVGVDLTSPAVQPETSQFSNVSHMASNISLTDGDTIDIKGRYFENTVPPGGTLNAEVTKAVFILKKIS